MFNENLDVFLDDFSVVASTGATTFSVIFDESHSPMDLGAEGRSIVATCKTSDTVSLNHGSAITIDGKPYSIVGIRPIEDGKFTQLDLKYG